MAKHPSNIRVLVLCPLFVVCTVPVFAQIPPITNPSGVEFTASADHNVTENGTPLVTRYVLEVYPVGNPNPAATRDLGKPSPVNGVITFTTLLSVIRPSLPSGQYLIRVAAEGPGGRNVSVASDPFDVSPRAPAAPAKPLLRQ